MSMTRHNLQSFLLLVTILGLCSGAFTNALTTINGTAQCKTTPDSPDWPSLSMWNNLNESVAGRLLQPSPPGAVCHPGQPTYDADLCPAVQAGWLTYDWHSRDPVSTDWNNWNNDTCLPDASYPCSGQGYPVYVVNATCAAEVQAAVRFAKQFHIRLVIKSSGHDYVGRSNAPNALSIWTHQLNSISIHDTFALTACDVEIAGGSVTVGGGSKMWDIQEALAPVNRTVVGGTGRTVSVGGYLTGGGHSILSPRYGLATDQVLELEVVTPQGELVTANECQNQDLFWAMRGGGGSTFGVITSATVKTHPSPQLIQALFAIVTPNPSPSSSAVMDMNAYLLSNFPSLMDAGLTGYTFIFPNVSNPLPFGPQNTTAGGIFGTVHLLDTQDPQDVLDLFDPLVAYINETWPGKFQTYFIPTPYASYWDWFQTNYDQSAAGSNTLVGSRLLTKETLEGTDQSVLSAALAQYASGGTATAYLVGGKGVRDVVPRGGSDAVLPAWRRAYIHSTVGFEYEPFNEMSKQIALSGMDYVLGAIRALEPDSGAYMNEAYPYEADWQSDFWGDHYNRLAEIKREVDPDDVLWCHPCVGNEGWNEIEGKLCRA